MVPSRLATAAVLILCVLGGVRADGPAAAKDGDGAPLPAGAVARLGTLRLRHVAPIHVIAFAPDGKTVATGGDQTVRLWDTATGKERRRFDGNYHGSRAVAFTPDGECLAACTADHKVRLYEATTGQPVR